MIAEEFMEIVRSALRSHPDPIGDLRVAAVEPSPRGPMVRWTGGPTLPRSVEAVKGGGTFLGPVAGPLILEGTARFLAARWRHGAPRIAKTWDRDLELAHPEVFQFGPCSGGGWSWLWQSSAEWIEERGMPAHFCTDDTKEKYGSLRWDYRAIDCTDAIDDVIEVAEALSGAICEGCGAPGYPRQGGWVKTYCDRCSNGRARR